MRQIKNWCIALIAAQGISAMPGRAATSPTAAAASGPGPVVFQFAIERTSEPLSLFNVIPPPLPLNEVLRMKGAAPAAGSEAIKGAVVPSTAPVVTAVSTAGAPSPAVTPSAVLSAAATTRTRPGLATLPGSKGLAAKAAPAAESLPRPVVPPKPPPPPTPTPNPYPDLVVLVGDKPLACRIVGDIGGSLRVELSNGTVVHLPKARVVRTQKAGPP